MTHYSHLPAEVIRRATLELPELVALIFEPHPPNPDIPPDVAAAVKASLTRFALFLAVNRLQTVESHLDLREHDVQRLWEQIYGRGL
ncbi:hypothetical protein GOD64_10885 [Sinorhizobium medicae]|nr:hypothetical protein [Sinorhizobium medicae]MDX0671885.1 hypothetical protein [Sinorhizobium medicae]MDX0709165.1 hypothetical protein [Sinorhizobium medicae]MDX0719345.1 hypothetical protein [Sinorhizobium medicae]MDX1218525.1 hypothetical protein [Sinorhizobium medicae]